MEKDFANDECLRRRIREDIKYSIPKWIEEIGFSGGIIQLIEY